jgi:hypothetical protein
MKLQLKTFKTNRLFWNKWLYKLVLNYTGPIRQIDVSYRKKHYLLVEFDSNLLTIADLDVKIRREHTFVSIFFNDFEIFDKIENLMSEWMKELHAPSSREEINFLTDNGSKKILCNALPHKKYQYKVAIKSTMDPNLRHSFGTWAQKYDGKIKFADHTLDWIAKGSHGYGWNPMVLISDSAILSMVLLFLGGSVGKVYEYVPRNSINNCNDQEHSCQHSVKI